MATDLFFLECVNPSCGFRFPLDLSVFEGNFCPRCSSSLRKVAPQIGQWQPKWSPPIGIRLFGVLDNIRSAHNVGSIFRTSEAAGISHLFLCGLTPSPVSNSALAKAALGAEDRVAWSANANAVHVVGQLKNEGFQIIALECTPQAQNLFSAHEAAMPPGKVALVVGNEPAGVDPGILALADRTLYIPMAGQKTSINVSVAFGVAMYGLLSAWSVFNAD
jgi:tRNA G18 (ribose-2'-O)-methylase SpoU